MLDDRSATFIQTRSIGSTTPLPQSHQDPLMRLKSIARSMTRSRSQTTLILQLMRENRIFTELPFSGKLLEEIANEVEIVSTEDDCRLAYSEGELLLFVSGSAYEYVQNFYQEPPMSRTGRRKSTNAEASQQFALIRKIKKGEYFSSYLPKSRYEGDHRKMQLVAQANTVILRVRDDLFHRYFEKKLEFHMHESYTLLQEFDMMRDLRKNLIFQLTKYLEKVSFGSGATLYTRGDRSDYFYFLRKGSVLLKEEKQPNFDKGPLNKKFVVRNTTSSLLLEPGSVIGVDGILINTSSDTRMYTAETVTDVEVWRIDKRPLIVLISSFNLSDNQPKKLNEVNLVTQLGEVEFTNKQQELLQENVRRIQTSEKKIRDIKLKSMGSTSGLKRRANSQTNVRVNSRQREDLYNDLRETVKTAGIHKLSEYGGVEQLRNIQNTPKLVQTSEPVTERPAPGGTAYSWFSPVQQTVNTILMAPDDSQLAPALNNSRINRPNHAPRSISSKIIRNTSNASKHGKDQRQIILSHLEKKRNSQLKSKLISVHENKADQKQSELVRVKRMFQGHPKKSLPTTPKQKQIEDALLSKMCNMNDSPLLFHMQSLRKKLLEGNATPFLRKVKHKLLQSGSIPPAHNTSQKENFSSKILIRDM